ncbi:hypothetical protein MCAP1_001287 [Malassezia caprae]|uniref:3-phytase n=1 Tax=Malassezia caprae TaxID=1381934 RepID=A0AAF0E5T3_9BASI|nr:hypothetical protein MCAP1_001287 [Malassezia caprae]
MGRQASSEWNQIFLPPVVQRLQPMLKGINLTNEDVMGMMSACAYETVGLGYSDFCRVFTKAEWENFEYSMDLWFQGDHGFMSPTGKAQGIGWVTELKHRLLRKPFAGPWSSQNATINKDPTYFPVDQPLYVDFTHDTVLTGILAALNLTQFSEFLDPERANSYRKYRASHLFPTDIGFYSDQVPGGPPFNAMADSLGSDHLQSVEMRWVPKNEKHSHASWKDLWFNLGDMSPYHPATELFPDMVKYSAVPKHCNIKQVHILHRHGAKYPDKGHKSGPGNFGKKIKEQRKKGELKVSGELSFLNDWDYDLGQKILTHYGSDEMFKSGVKHYYEYAKLLDNFKGKPVFRTSSHSRVLDSARYFALGFFGWDATSKYNLEVLTEEDYQNNTLASKNACRNADNDDFMYDTYLSSQWQPIYLEAPRKRLQKSISSINLTHTDVYNMMLNCPYLTYGAGFSQFCNLFTAEEWRNFEYDQDLQTYGDHGFMNPTARAQGVPYVQDLTARLLKKRFTGPVTAQNMTLNLNSTYTPLNQPLYADFSHHSVITGIMTALNLTQFKDWLDPTKPNHDRKYRTSHVTPLAMRMAWEVMDCDMNGGKEEYIRMKLNDIVYPLDESNGCSKRKDGLCKLNDYAEFLTNHAYKASKFDLVCFGKNKTDFTLTGPVTDGVIPNKDIHS